MNTKKEAAYTTNVGDHLVIQITGDVRTYIAEITQSDPLKMKVKESGAYSNLQDGDYIIDDVDSPIVQNDDKRNECSYLLWRESKGLAPAISGLASLNVPSDGKLYEILPRV